MFGLLDRDVKYLQESLKGFKEIEKAVVFGSRAIGNYKKGSDVDIALFGTNITPGTISRLADQLNEESLLPYFFDLLHYEQISNPKLKQHIISIGKELYCK
ncbi:nucleotidyltransferase domain-containing protein [Neobacillus sp. SM06]|uniref:nucleotidyltransferase domain-containing protein n=1 Tax=Neobacillus sp. SM06 TaxID=3422492 RepID=UPI003D274482